MIRIELPRPPSLNNLYVNVPKRGRVRSKRYLTWIQAAKAEIAAQRPPRVDGDYVLWLYVERPDNRKRDIFNLPKAVEDLLVEQGLVEDDSRCVEGHVVWAGQGRRCTVMIEPAKPIAMAVAA